MSQIESPMSDLALFDAKNTKEQVIDYRLALSRGLHV